MRSLLLLAYPLLQVYQRRLCLILVRLSESLLSYPVTRYTESIVRHKSLCAHTHFPLINWLRPCTILACIGCMYRLGAQGVSTLEKAGCTLDHWRDRDRHSGIGNRRSIRDNKGYYHFKPMTIDRVSVSEYVRGFESGRGLTAPISCPCSLSLLFSSSLTIFVRSVYQ